MQILRSTQLVIFPMIFISFLTAAGSSAQQEWHVACETFVDTVSCRILSSLFTVDSLTASAGPARYTDLSDLIVHLAQDCRNTSAAAS